MLSEMFKYVRTKVNSQCYHKAVDYGIRAHSITLAQCWILERMTKLRCTQRQGDTVRIRRVNTLCLTIHRSSHQNILILSLNVTM